MVTKKINSYYKNYEALKKFKKSLCKVLNLKPIYSSVQLFLFYFEVPSHYKKYGTLKNLKTKPLEGVQSETNTFNSRTGSILH